MSFLLGLLCGAALVAIGAWLLTRVWLRRARAAEARAGAAERMAEIGAMTGGLAHEIKNPLSTIGLNAQLLAESVGDLSIDQDERRRVLARVTTLGREVDRLRDILSDFLEFAGKVQAERRQTDVRELIEELIDFYQPEADRQGVRLRCQLPDEPLIAWIDPKLIKQAVLNLMLNATQAMVGARGSAEPSEAGDDLILRGVAGRDDEGREVVKVHVTDTGPGIEPGTLTRIFEPYYTTRGGVGGGGGGSGLGLPTSRRLIEAHEGEIHVHSEVGKGTDFVLALPVRPDEATLARL